MSEQKEYTATEIDNYFKNDDLSILLKLPDDFFNIARAKNYIQKFPYHTVAIYAFCDDDVRANPMVIYAALPGLAKARRMDMLPAKLHNDKDIMLKAIKASSEAYFSLPEELKDDLDFHLELAQEVPNMLELPISPVILANAKFLYNCIDAALPPYIKNQILNAEIPDLIKSELLMRTRQYLYENNISLEFVKSQVLIALEEMIIQQNAMEHNLSQVDYSRKFTPKFNERTNNIGVYQPFSPEAISIADKITQQRKEKIIKTHADIQAENKNYLM